MNGVFLDTVGIIAVWDTSDQAQAAAAVAAATILASIPRLTPYEWRRSATRIFRLCHTPDA